MMANGRTSLLLADSCGVATPIYMSMDPYIIYLTNRDIISENEALTRNLKPPAILDC
jgi:hypothetical protein